MDVNKESSNDEYISDFLARIATIAGNASLIKNGNLYIINVRKENGEFITYCTNDFLIKEGVSEEFLSTKETSLLEDEEFDEDIEDMAIICNDARAWESIRRLPKILKGSLAKGERYNIEEMDPKAEELAEKLAREFSGKVNYDVIPPKTEEEIEKKIEYFAKEILQEIKRSGKIFVQVEDYDKINISKEEKSTQNFRDELEEVAKTRDVEKAYKEIVKQLEEDTEKEEKSTSR